MALRGGAERDVDYVMMDSSTISPTRIAASLWQVPILTLPQRAFS